MKKQPAEHSRRSSSSTPDAPDEVIDKKTIKKVLKFLEDQRIKDELAERERILAETEFNEPRYDKEHFRHAATMQNSQLRRMWQRKHYRLKPYTGSAGGEPPSRRITTNWAGFLSK